MLRRPRIRSKFRFSNLIKSEQINALRKQYDSFLEDDKKRKERNDYILGRLDKMRYSNMAVQLHQTPTPYRDFLPPSFSRHSYQAEKQEPTTVDRINTMQLVQANQSISRSGYQSSQSDVSRNYLEETSILNEISKKYILIPKLKYTFPNASLEAIPSLVAEPVSSAMPDIESNDWKSKYDILKQLKSKEKEEDISKCANQEPRSQLGGDQVLQNYNHDIITTYEHEIPVKDVTNEAGIDIVLKENSIFSEKNDQIQISDGGSDCDVLYKNVNDLGEKIEHGLLVEESAVTHDQSFQGVLNNENTVNYPKSYPKQEYLQGISKNNPSEHQKSYPEEEYAQGALNYDNSVEYKNSDPEQEYAQEVITNHNTIENKKSDPEQEYAQEVMTNYNTVENQKTNPDQEYIREVTNNDNTIEYQNSYPEQEYPIEYEQFIPEQVPNVHHTEQAKAFETKNADSVKKPTYNPDEGILEYDRLPTTATRIISSTTADMDENIEAEITHDNSDTFAAGIEEFDAEQRELFHPQNTDENYTYYEQDGTYNAEYTQEQNYPQSQEYAYYEGTEQELPPVEINEHEETQQHYDPEYEQQYMATYEQPEEEKQQHVYMEPDSEPLPEPNFNLNQIQDFEILPQEIVMNVEEVLAKEEGLTEVCEEVEPVVLTEM